MCYSSRIDQNELLVKRSVLPGGGDTAIYGLYRYVPL